MTKKILVTGGAGFIGSHTIDALVQRGHQVRLIDNLDEEVHGSGKKPPSYLNASAELIVDDIRNSHRMAELLQDTEAVYHFAAKTAVGQSMLQANDYVDVNLRGTALLWDLILHGKSRVEKIILASSRASYGEGIYFCQQCGLVYPRLRPETQLKQQQWEIRCDICHNQVTAQATPEDKPLCPISIYGITKKTQEEICLTLGNAHGIPVTVLRYFNVFGPRQSLLNPYVGIASIFCKQALAQKGMTIFEDGKPLRDFIHISDVITANVAALENPRSNGQIINIGTGAACSILDFAKSICAVLGVPFRPIFTGEYRLGDVRSCFADTRRMQEILNIQAQKDFLTGIEEVISWAQASPKR